MEAKNLWIPVLGLLLVLNLVMAVEFKYEFGKRKSDDIIIYNQTGYIPDDDIGPIPIKPGVVLTYVKLIVDAIEPLRVEFDWETQSFSTTSSDLFIRSPFQLEARGVVLHPPIH